MPRDDYVEHCITILERIPRVVDSSISGLTIQRFFEKIKPTILPIFCQTMLGHQDGGKFCVKAQTDVDLRFFRGKLDEKEEIQSPDSLFPINEAYHTIKQMFTMAVDPEGIQVANYITLLAKCLWISKQLTNGNVAKDMDFAVKSLFLGNIETCKSLLRSFSENDGYAMKHLSDISKRGRLSTWPNKAMYYKYLPDFAELVRRFCIGERSKKHITLDDLTKLFQKPNTNEPGDILFYKNVGNDGVFPFWVFYKPEAIQQPKFVDVSRLVKSEPFIVFSKMSVVGNKRARDKLLQSVEMKKSWAKFSTAVVINNPFTGQDGDFVRSQADKYWTKQLSSRDFVQGVDVLRKFAFEMKVRKTTIPRELCQIFVKFLKDLTFHVKPIPNLEHVPAQQEEDDRFKKILRRQIDEGGQEYMESPPLEVQMEERRLQLQEIYPPPKDDSGIILPVLLLAAAIFLFST
jgi:hypothetical protein